MRSMANQKNLVLLGVGHTNAHIVHEWATQPIEGYRLICISKFATATYSGMLPGTLGEQFAENEMQIQLAPLVQRAGAELLIADVNGLDLNARQVTFSDHDPLDFDLLSIGVGSMPAGWDTHSSPLVVPIKPMQTFLQRLDQRIQCAAASHAQAPLRIAIVGGGVAGIEIAFCLQQRLQDPALSRDSVVEIFTSSRRVADGMRTKSVRRIETLLQTRGIKVHPSCRVTSVSSDALITDDGQRHEFDGVIWATGAGAPPVLSKLGLQTDDRGFIATSKTLQSLSDPRIFAVGDSGTIVDSPCPKAGVYAVRQCPVIWHNLNAFPSDKPLVHFEPQKDFLKLLNTGDGKALLEYRRFTVHAGWCWNLKTWIDKRFISTYQLQP